MEPQPDFIINEISQARIMISRVLGEEVEQVRLELEVGDIDCEEADQLKVNKCT